MKQLYFKLPFDNQIISEIKDLYIKSGQEQLVFYIDLNGINKASFNPDVIIQEIKDGNENKYFINDLKIFLKKLLTLFKSCNVKLVLFFDEGGSKQNKDIDIEYKAQRVSVIQKLIDDGKITQEEADIYKKLKSEYNQFIEENANLNGKIITINLKNYESDLVAHYYIKKNLLPNSLNMILAIDKDLLQSLYLPNTYQLSFSYKPSLKNWEKIIWNDKTAIFKLAKNKESFIKKLNKFGYSENNHPFTSKTIVYMLSLFGDKSDNVPQLWSRLGEVTALELVEENKLYDFKINTLNINAMKNLKIVENFDRFRLNLQLVDFDAQIDRLPKNIIEYLNKKIELLQ